MKQLPKYKQCEEHTHVRVWNVVFLQGDDYLQMEDDLHMYAKNDEYRIYPRHVSEKRIINYLRQWDCGSLDEMSCHDYDLNYHDINTPFLGYKRGKNMLFSHNDSMGYAGLSYFEFIRKD